MKTVTRRVVHTLGAGHKAMFNVAIRWKMASENPMKGVRLLRCDNLPRRTLNQEEIGKLLNACTPYSKPIVLMALSTGMRKSEILTLRWSDVDMHQRVITLLHTKSGKVRKIPISETLLQSLTALQYNNRKSENVFPCARTGEPSERFTTAWQGILRRSGLRLRFHDLRHVALSGMVTAGVDLQTVREIAGHASIQTTSLYLHAQPETKRQAVAALESQLGFKAEKNGEILESSANSKILKISVSS